MSARYTADGRRKSSMTHAGRKWTCVCGRVVHGNGGRSSHQRSCVTYLAKMVESATKMAEEFAVKGKVGLEAHWLLKAEDWQRQLDRKMQP